MNSPSFQKIPQKIEGYRDEMSALQTALIAIPAISPAYGGKGELKKAEFLEPILKDTFGDVKWTDARLRLGKI